MKTLSMLSLMLLLVILNNQVVYSQSVQWSTFSSGGNVSTVSTTQLVSTIGQQFVGSTQNANTAIESGFLVHGAFGPTNINEGKQLPQKYSLFQNYPNPFNPSTTVHFELPKESYVTLKVYNMLGQEVLTVLDNEFEAGRYNVKIDGANISSGLYFYRLVAADFIQTKKMMLVK